MFELKKENIKFGKLWGDENSIFFLPNGIYEVNANQVNKVKSNKCFFIDEKCSTIMLGANRKLNCCGDILITLKEMGYDISKKENLKKLKDDKDKIVEKYNDLKKNDPGLFELNQLEIDDIKNQYEAELEEAKVKQSDLKQKQQNETTATASNASSGTQIKWGRVFFVFIIFCGTCGYLINQNKIDPEEMSSAWFNYSQDKLRTKLSQILGKKDKNGDFVYKYYPTYRWNEKMGYTSASGTITYKRGGRGEAKLYNSLTGSSASESGTWKIQWAPATYGSPYDSDIIFTINDSYGQFSRHIGESNTLWTSVEEFCDQYLSKSDKNIFMAFGDSLLNVFMKENNCSIGSSGRFE